MPEPQRTDGGGTQGEDSVSSVSFELISRVMEAKESRESDMHIKFLNQIKVLGPHSIMAPLKVLNMDPQFKFGTNQKGWTSLPILGSPPFMVLDWSQKSRPYGPIWPQHNPFKIGPRRTSISPMYRGTGPRDCSARAAGCKNQKWPDFKFQGKMP
ncbi:hypothetical protein O181_031672 [Austropuccinia psidii MF-1]|uniref:Uncharacterized protein n=1 Tax=Austropuccinia psidii MF-1 TaxID=1389203 RepID=A0A9Q3D141_9BASI|nr:hypothetical protein [Austropuccinia psidii MF-1]